MKQEKKAFLEILKLELEDLDEDIKVLIQEYTEKHDREEITNYVFKRNIALMQSEIFGVEGFLEDIRNMDPVTYDTLDHLMETVISKLHERVKTKGLPQSLIYLVERKVRKVAGYIQHTDEHCE